MSKEFLLGYWDKTFSKKFGKGFKVNGQKEIERRDNEQEKEDKKCKEWR